MDQKDMGQFSTSDLVVELIKRKAAAPITKEGKCTSSRVECGCCGMQLELAPCYIDPSSVDANVSDELGRLGWEIWNGILCPRCSPQASSWRMPKIESYRAAYLRTLVNPAAENPPPMLGATLDDADLWMQTASGRKVHVCVVKPDDVDIIDAAQSLSMQCRFGGHCNAFYSVAEHCCRAADVVENHLGRPEHAFDALMHDLSEYLVVDMPRPVKSASMMWGYRSIEKRVHKVVRSRFGLPEIQSESAYAADGIMLATEAKALMTHPPSTWNLRYEPIDMKIECWSPAVAMEQFLLRFERLSPYARTPAGGAR